MKIYSGSQIKFDKDYLNELTSEPNSGVFKQQCKYHIALHPAQFNDFGQSIKDELGKNIAKYDESCKGIMLGFTDVKLPSHLGVIGPDNCYVHIDVRATFFVFRPEIDMVLKGKVTQTTKDHVGCLVYNTFNISLPKPSDDDGNWLGRNAAVNAEAEFRITFVDLTARLPYIRGELRSIVTPVDENGADTSLAKSKGKLEKKNKKKRFPSEGDETSLHTEIDIKEDMDDGEDIIQDKSQKKHKKKHKIYSHSEINIKEDPDNIEESIHEPKESKRKHKVKHEHLLHTELDIKEDPEDIEMENTVLEHKSKKKSKKDKKHKLEKDQMDISLESLDIKSLFSNSSVDFNQSASQNQEMADSADKKVKRRRSHSVSQDTYLDSVKLEEDSDLEKIIRKKERKRSKSLSK